MSQILQGLPTDTENFTQLFPTRGIIYELFPEIASEQDLVGKRQDINWIENDYINSRSFNLNRTSSLEIKYTEDISKEPDTFLFASESAVVSKENDSTENFSRILSDSHLQKPMDKKVNDSIALSAQSSPKAPKSKRRSANTAKKNTNATTKRGKKENQRIKQEKKKEENIKIEQEKKEDIKINYDQENQNAEIKQEESEDCIDVETIPDEIPVLQASDANSLLEQFEASQEVLSSQYNEAEIKNDSISCMNSIKTQQITKKEDQSNMPKKSLRTCIPQQKSPSKEVIDRIKASTQKGYISIIPAMSETKKHYETIRKPVAPCNKNKLISKGFKRSSNILRVSIIRDHDYCNPILPNSPYSFNNHLKSNQNEMINKICNKTKEDDNNSKKQLNHSTRLEELPRSTALKMIGTNLLKTNAFDKIQEATSTLANTKTDKINDIAFENKCQKILLEQSQGNNSSSVKNVNASNKYSKTRSVIDEVKIRSALAASIIESRNNMQANSKIQMVSVLKKPPNVSQSSLLKSNSSENVASIPSNTDKYLERMQNLIIQNTPESPHEEEKKQPRKKLNLAEYRNRRDLNSDKTNSSAQRAELNYVCHAFTVTEPIKDKLNNPVWVERICLIKDPDVEEAKNKEKLQTRNIGIQVAEESEERKENDIKTEVINKENPNNKHNLSSSLSKSSLQSKTKRKRSRSKSRSKSRNRTSIGNRTESKRSRSRSIIIIDTDDSKSSSRSRSRSRNRNRNRSKSMSRSRSNSRSTSNSRSRSISKSRTRTRTGIRIRTRSRTRSRSRSRCRSMSRSRSRSRSRSSRSRRRSNTRRRRLSHRRSSVSSVSSWTSQSRSYGTSTSRSSSRSRTSSQYHSSCSRSSSRSEFGRDRWSNHYRNNNDERERIYDKYQRHSFNSHRAYRDVRSSPKHSYNRSYDSDRYYRETKRTDVEQRKILYVGRLNEGVTKADLIDRFEIFGPIKNISLHFHKNGNNYGFVTFEHRIDAYKAKEHGNDDPSLPRYELSFGGRRAFCQDTYTDLDNMSNSSRSNRLPQRDEQSFDYLLQEAQARMKKKV